MSEQSTSSLSRAHRHVGSLAPGEYLAWSVMSTLVGGPLLYGLIGWGTDELVGTTRVFLPVGVMVGFVLSFVIVYKRYGADPGPAADPGSGP